MPWKRLLAYIAGTVDQALLLRNEYLVTENKILRSQIRGRLRLTDGERKTLAEIGKQLERKGLAEVANIRFARENRTRGYDRIVGALANLGHAVSDQTVDNVVKRHGIPPAPQRKRTTIWKEFILTHTDMLAITDFFTTELWTKAGLVTYYVLFFIHVATRRVHVAGLTRRPNDIWMTQLARNVTMTDVTFLRPGQFLSTTATPSSPTHSTRL